MKNAGRWRMGGTGLIGIGAVLLAMIAVDTSFNAGEDAHERAVTAPTTHQYIQAVAMERSRPVTQPSQFRMKWSRPFGGKQEAFEVWCPDKRTVRVIIGSTETRGEFWSPCADLSVRKGGVTVAMDDVDTVVRSLHLEWTGEAR